MANNADPDLDLHCLQRQSISGFSRTRVKRNWYNFKGNNSNTEEFPSHWRLLFKELIFPSCLGRNSFL